MDDMSAKIGEMLSKPENIEMIKNIMTMFGGSGGMPGAAAPGQSTTEQSGGSPQDGAGQAQNTGGPSDGTAAGPSGMPSGFGGLPFDQETMLKMKKALDAVRKDDPRVALLLALRPNLSDERQHKVDEAISLMRLVNLIPLLQEGAFGKF